MNLTDVRRDIHFGHAHLLRTQAQAVGFDQCFGGCRQLAEAVDDFFLNIVQRGFIRRAGEAFV